MVFAFFVYKKGAAIMGRPSKYETEIVPHLEDIRKAVEAGATVEEIAKMGLSID